VEGNRLPKEKEGDFLNCLDWISFSLDDSKLRMERVRRVVSQGGINYVGLVEGDGEARMVISAEKEAPVVFDSMDPISEELEDVELDGMMGTEEKPLFYWCQLGEDDIEIWLYVGEVVKSLVKVKVEGRRLEAEVRGVIMLQGELAGPVEQDSWTWSLDGGKLAVMLTKSGPGPWPTIWSMAGGSKGEQVTELVEDRVLAHLTSENPLTGVSRSEAQAGFNSDQLEECDSCDTQDRLVWVGGGEAAVSSLEGRQHLFTLPSLCSSNPQLCTRYDVDGLIWKIDGEGANHVATFPALGYVQASKTSRKFIAAPASARYSVICDSSRHVYLYRQPEALAAEMGLRNRKSGEKVEKVAKQQVITLESSGEILGLVAGENSVFVLTGTTIWTLAVN